MPYLGIVGLVLVALLCFAAFAGRAAAADKPAAAPPPVSAPAGKEAVKPVSPMTQQELAQKLRALERSAPPEKLSPGAECYKPSRPLDTAEYVCPKCGARTQYSKSWSTAELIHRSLPQIRRQLQELRGLDVSVDESQLCRKCTPKAPEAPQLTLVVRHPDGSTVRTAGVDAEDLVLLREFVEGKLVHAGAQDEESPLKKHQARLEALLGVQAAK